MIHALGMADMLAGALSELGEELTSTRLTRLLGQGCRATVIIEQWSYLSDSHS